MIKDGFFFFKHSYFGDKFKRFLVNLCNNLCFFGQPLNRISNCAFLTTTARGFHISVVLGHCKLGRMPIGKLWFRYSAGHILLAQSNFIQLTICIHLYNCRLKLLVFDNLFK